MKRILIGSVLAAVVLFLWGFVYDFTSWVLAGLVLARFVRDA